MPKLFISTTVGPGDATRASVPFHIALNGAAATGTECGIAFAGDATELLKPNVSDAVRGVGIPPLKTLLEGLVTKGVRFYV
jgi:predicted peroxiredoxin